MGGISQFFRRTWWDPPVSSIELRVSKDMCQLTPANIRSNPISSKQTGGDLFPIHLADQVRWPSGVNGQAVCLHLTTNRGERTVSVLHKRSWPRPAIHLLSRISDRAHSMWKVPSKALEKQICQKLLNVILGAAVCLSSKSMGEGGGRRTKCPQALLYVLSHINREKFSGASHLQKMPEVP